MRQRRFAKKKLPREVFLIICEGETEREYAEMLKLHYRLPVTIKTKISGNKINQRLVNQYMAELGIGKEDNCRIFYLYDADVEDITERLSQLKGILILSNPCVELWYILHVKEYRKQQNSNCMVKDLTASHAIWTNYQKGRLNQSQSKLLTDYCLMASARARQLVWHQNPSSNMYLLIDAMEEAKKR